MPAPPAGAPPPLPFDLEAARGLAAALDRLALVLTAAARADAERVGAATRDWRGHTRTWFDHRHEAAIVGLRAAARLSAQAAADVRRAEATALAAHLRRIQEAERAAAVELVRLVAFGEGG